MNTMKRLTLLLLVLTISLSIILPAQAATVNSAPLSGVQIFPKDHIWNTRVDNLPVAAKSDIYIKDLIKDTAGYTGLDHYIKTAIPYNVVNSTQRHQYILKFNYNGAYSDNVPYPIPDNPLFEEGIYDHHMEIIDVDEMVLYELGSVKQWPNGSWSASTGAVWDLKGYSFRKNNETPMWATNEAGLATFPGLVRYDEVSAGHIDHLLIWGVPLMQNTWVWPARSSAPIPGYHDPTSPPAGQRFRLKASYDISGFPPQAKVILQALKTYGAMVATNTGFCSDGSLRKTGSGEIPCPPPLHIAGAVTVIGSPDTQWNTTDLNTLWRVNISDFEAVDVSSVIIDENSAQARQPPVVTPTPIANLTTTITARPINGILNMAIPLVCIVILAICCVVGFFRK